MNQPDINTIMTWNSVKISELGNLLKSQGFSFVKTFSTDEYRIFSSADNSLIVILEKNLGKVYSPKNRKHILHTFSVIK